MSAGCQPASGRGYPDRPGEDVGDGAVADRPCRRRPPAAATRLCRRPAGGRGSGDTVRGTSALEHALRAGREAGARRDGRAPHLHAARRIRRQPGLAGRSLEARHRGRDHRHDRLPVAVRRLRRVARHASVPCRLPRCRRARSARRSASVPAVRSPAPASRVASRRQAGSGGRIRFGHTTLPPHVPLRHR